MLMNAKKPIKLNKTNLEIIILIQVIIIIFLIIFRLVYQPLVFKQDSLVYIFSCTLCGITIWSLWSWYILTKSLFNPYILFVLSAFLFNGGHAILEVFHLNKSGDVRLWELSEHLAPLSLESILNTLFLVIIGLAALHLGALISIGTAKLKYLKNYSEKTAFVASKNCYIIGNRLLLISFLPAIFVLRDAVIVVMSSGYFSLHANVGATSFSAAPKIIADFLIPGSLFLLAGSKDRPQSRLLSVAIIITYVMTQFFLGERNKAIMPLISLAWIWHQLIRPIPKTLLLSTSSFILFFVFPVVQLSRNTAGKDRLSIDTLLETFSSINNPVVAILSEMGGSMMTVSYTMEIVPKYIDFQMGMDYLYALFTIVPNVFGKLHPTVARGLPNHWLTEQINPPLASTKGSYGFSFIAEAYLNFGWIGTPIALGIMGFLFVKLVLWAEKSYDPAKMAMIASFLSFLLFYARAESALIVRALIWYSLIPYLSVRLLNSSSSKKLAK